MQGDGGSDGGLLGAGGEAVGGIFDVAAGDVGAVGEEEGGTYAETAVGRVGVFRCLCGEGAEVFDLLQGEAAGMIVRSEDGRHGLRVLGGEGKVEGEDDFRYPSHGLL